MKSTSKIKNSRRWAALLSLLIMLSLLLPFRSALAVAGQVDANNVSSTPAIDGNLNETGWNFANSASKTTIGTPNNTVTFAAMWDATNLYVAVKVLDGNLFNDSANTWEDDSVEVYIDANNNTGTTYDSFDRQFVKGYNDATLGGIGSQTGVQHAWAAIPGGYSTEMAIPWSNLGVSPTSGLTIGFDVGYNDDDNAGTRDSQAVWWGTVNNYNNTSAFGKLVLIGSSVPTATLTRTPTGSAPMPDLTVSSITYVGSTPPCANNPRDNVVVSNIGNLNAGAFSVSFNSQTQSVTSLAVGQSITLSFGAVPGTSTATADSTNVIPESNESNNSLTASLPAPTQAPTCTPTSAASPTSTPTATQPTGQSAYPSGVAWAVPGTIQAENYDLGGETIAYHDVDAGNAGSQYRADGVDIEASTDTGGGYNVGWTRTDEWLEYTVNVASAGSYTLTERIASGAATGSFRVEFNGVDKTGTVAVPNTGGWQTWQSISQTVNLSAGVQIMRVYFLGNDSNWNYLALTSTVGPTNTSTLAATFTRTPTATVSGQSAYPSGVAWAIPGTIQVENFDMGGETVAYHDNETLNQGGQYRTSDGVDIEATGDTGGGYNVGWTMANEWLEYTINVPSAGNYTLTERIASPNSTSSFRVEFNGIDKTGTVAVPNTGGWQTWQSISQTVNLSAGVQVMRIYIVTDGFNINYVSLNSAGSATVTPTPTAVPPNGTGVKGRTFVGYQGWFSAIGDGSTFNQWFHWSNGGIPGPGNIKVELYPDTREYTTLFQTNFANLGNGSPAKLFSAYTTDTINVHFRWMRENNIDGAGLQRFGTDIANPSMKAFRDSVTSKVRTAAEANGRNFYIMYDVTGMSGNWSQQIQDDWTNTMMNTLNVTSSPMYAREGSKPVVCIWGMGYSHTPGTASEWIALINWFKAQNIYVIGGTPRDWRTGTGDSKPGFLAAYTTLNMISPWTVGAYSTDADVDNYKNNTLILDRDYTLANGMDYQPVVFAGFAWSNWNGGTRNMIPRRQGNLFWRQVFNLKSSNISTMYVAMFDEYDEGTAIAKAAEDSSMIPTNQYFLTLDADGVHMSSDFYLRLTGAANQMLKGQIPLSLTIPIGH